MGQIRSMRSRFESIPVQQISRNQAFDPSKFEWPPGQPDDVPIALSLEELSEVTSDNTGYSNNQGGFLSVRASSLHLLK